MKTSYNHAQNQFNVDFFEIQERRTTKILKKRNRAACLYRLARVGNLFHERLGGCFTLGWISILGDNDYEPRKMIVLIGGLILIF